MKTKISTKTIKYLNSPRRQLAKVQYWQTPKTINQSNDILFYNINSGNISKSKRKLFMAHLRHKVLRRATKEDFMHLGSFQEAIGPVLLLAQILALMPVYGVTLRSATDLRFSWFFLRTWYSMLVVVLFGICSGLTMAHALHGVLNFDSVETIIFFTSIFIISVAFIHVARKWPKLMQEWQQVEQDLPQQSNEMERSRLAHKIKMIALVATLCSLVEHLFSMLTIIYYVNRCPVFENHPIQSFLYSNFAQLFHFVNYNNTLGILGKVVNVLSTFAWNFNDIFLMCVCVALSAKFRQLNDFMQKYLQKSTTREFWIERRRNYRTLCRLCERVDDAIAPITLLCFSNNLYFICNKILKSLQKKPSFTHTLYFWYSLVFLLGRTFILAIYAANINDESKRPLLIFRKIKREFWCPELKRFSEEVNADVVAISGMKFFHLTRTMVLTVAGSIVTYELVLLQFNKQDRVNDCHEN